MGSDEEQLWCGVAAGRGTGTTVGSAHHRLGHHRLGSPLRKVISFDNMPIHTAPSFAYARAHNANAFHSVRQCVCVISWALITINLQVNAGR